MGQHWDPQPCISQVIAPVLDIVRTETIVSAGDQRRLKLVKVVGACFGGLFLVPLPGPNRSRIRGLAESDG